jgi:hypothetical protein
MKSGRILQHYPFVNGLEGKTDRKAFTKRKCEWFQRCRANQTIHTLHKMGKREWNRAIFYSIIHL